MEDARVRVRTGTTAGAGLVLAWACCGHWAGTPAQTKELQKICCTEKSHSSNRVSWREMCRVGGGL
eukprot:690437-Rhodomonas_salina.1